MSKLRSLSTLQYTRDAILGASKGYCYLCNNKIKSTDLSWDHVVPLSRGGGGLRFNKMPTHERCNNSRRDEDISAEQRLAYKYVMLAVIANSLSGLN